VNRRFDPPIAQAAEWPQRPEEELGPFPSALIVPDPLAAPATSEKANILTLLGIKKLMDELQGRRARRAVKKSVFRSGILILIHSPPN
jgi:hypothetical protein